MVNANIAWKKETEAGQRRDVMEKDQREEVEGGQSHSSISTQYINVGIGTNVC